MDKPASAKAPAKKSNWLTIFGILVLVIIVLGILAMVFIVKPGMKNPIVKQVIALEPELEAMKIMTQDQIQNQARMVTPADLDADPYPYGGMFVVTEGTVSQEESIGVNQNIALSVFEDYPVKGYVVDDSLVIIDVTGEGPELKDGSVIKGFGKLFVLRLDDVWALPVVGPNLKTEFGNVEGMADRVVFLLSKGVQVVSTPQAAPADAMAPAEGSTPPADGTVPPADGTAPPADAVVPPAEGTPPPPAEGGTTPPPAEGGK
jgi:hypothetical protein